MSTSTNPNTQSPPASNISRFQAITHLPRMFKTAGAVMQDSRVSILPKLGFVAGIGALLLLLVAPEAAADIIAVIPGATAVLDLIGVPVEGAVDWLALGLAAFNLMKLFPQDIVNEHYDEVAGKPTTPLTTGPVVDADPNH